MESPKEWLHIGHAWRTTFMSLGSERHLFSPNSVKKLYLNGLPWRLNFTKVMPQGPHQCLLDPRDIPSIQSLSKNNKKRRVIWRFGYAKTIPVGPHQCLSDPKDIPSKKNKNQSYLKVWLHKGHASRTTPTSLRSERHSFSPNFVQK
jgi:hypothetical protein